MFAALTFAAAIAHTPTPEPSYAVYGHVDGQSGFADMASLTRDGERASIEILWLVDQAHAAQVYAAYSGSTEDFYYEISRIEIDCAAWRVSSSGYDVFSRTGERVYQERPKPSERAVVEVTPGMMFHVLLRSVCRGEELPQRFTRSEVLRIAEAFQQGNARLF